MKLSLLPPVNRYPVLLVGLLVPCALAGCRRSSSEDEVKQVLKSEVKTAKKQLTEIGNLVMEGGKLGGQDIHGRPLWSLEAKEIRVKGEGEELQPRRATLTGARARLYRDGKPESTFQAAHIEFYNTSNTVRLVMTGGVRAITTGVWTGKRGPVTMQSPQAEVNVKNHHVRAKNVSMTQGTVRVTGQELTADTALALAQLNGNIKATSPEGNVTADKATWKWKDGQAQATGKVVARHQQTTITGSRLDANTAVSRGTLSGNVQAQAPQGKATASTVSFNWASDVIVARGSVTLTKDNGSLQAARIDTDSQFNTANAEGTVVARQGDMIIRAGSVATSGKMSRVLARSGVTLTGPDLRVTAARVEASDINTSSQQVGRLIASGDVHLVRGPLDMTAQNVNVTGVRPQAKTADRIVASGGVFARNADGTVRATRVTWSGGQVIAEGSVTLNKDNNVFTGSRLQSDDTFQQAALSGNVRGKLDKGIMVTAGDVLWQRLQKRIIARHNVTAKRETVQLRANRMDANDSGTKATLTGNVVVTTDAGATLRAPTMRYDRNAGQGGKVYASNGVWFKDPQRKVQGQGKTLVYNVKSGEAVVTQGSGSTDMQVFKGGKFF